jgi:hypothetical protein
MSDDDFIAQLEACTLPEDRFHHADHLHAAWLYLTRFPVTEAIARFSEILRSYATSLGKADRYHETITWAYLLLLNERIHCSKPMATWEEFAAAHADLFDWKNSILLHYYQKETLQSELARRIFVMPDRFERPLSLTYKMTETESLLR